MNDSGNGIGIKTKETFNERGGIRKKYQQIAEAQQRSSILLQVHSS
jgi:hypothetical protein